MLAAGLIEMPPVSKHDALADEGDRRLAFLAAVPAHDHDAAFAFRSLPDAEQRAHAEFRERLLVQNLDRDAGLAQRRCAAREFFRVENIRRLVDEIARHHDALGDRFALGEDPARGRDIADADADRHLDALGALLAFLGLGLVAGEIVGPQQHAEPEIGGGIGLEASAGGLGQNRDLGFTAGHPSHHGPAELDRVLGFRLVGLAGPGNDQPADLEAVRRHDGQGRPGLAGEMVGRRGAADLVGGGGQELAGGGSEFQL